MFVVEKFMNDAQVPIVKLGDLGSTDYDHAII